MFRIAPLILMTLFASTPDISEATSLAAGSGQTMRSATKARDIGGFALGMNIRDAAKLSSVTNIGNDQYQSVRDGIVYDFGVTRLGRIYRVDSSQHLGQFRPDAAFMRDLTAKLTAKYGRPLHASFATFNWSLVEPVKRPNGETLPFETNWASAYFDDGPDVTVHIKLIDFRIMWQDDAALNHAPRNQAIKAISL